MTTINAPDTEREETWVGADRASATPLRAWARLMAVLGSRMYRAFLLGLVAVAVAPVLLGWGSYVVESGSMEPSIQVGDVVVAKPYTEDQQIRVGRVFVFDDPAPDQ